MSLKPVVNKLSESQQIMQLQKTCRKMFTAQIKDLQITAAKSSSMQADSEMLVKSLEKLAQAAKNKMG